MNNLLKDDEVYQEIKKFACPKRLQSMYMIDVEQTTLNVFEKIGYQPSRTVKKAIDKAWVNSNREDFLADYIYKVWRFDNEH